MARADSCRRWVVQGQETFDQQVTKSDRLHTERLIETMNSPF